ncbi:M15 family metallopeptidase [Mesorhizobium sp. WSM3873]|nr:M15 family metallopeptidase [Mesorhizobium sp. WSM3873]
MRAAGFRNYGREWWHFTLADEPFPKQRLDFR